MKVLDFRTKKIMKSLCQWWIHKTLLHIDLEVTHLVRIRWHKDFKTRSKWVCISLIKKMIHFLCFHCRRVYKRFI